MRRDDSLEKILKLGKTQGRRSEQYIDNEMVGWHHRLNAHEFEQTLGESEGRGSLACCSPQGSQRVGHDLATEQQQFKLLATHGSLDPDAFC